MFNRILIFLVNCSYQDVSNITDIIVKIVGLPTAIAAVITLIIRLLNSHKERRKEAFKKRLQKVDTVRSTSTIENEKIYKEMYGEKLAPSYGLIIDKNWPIYGDDKIKIDCLQDMILLSDIKTEVSNLDKEIKIPSLKIYPNHNKHTKNQNEQNYVENLIKYGDRKTYLFNGKLYAAKDIVKDGNKVKFLVHRTDYYSFLNTCKALELLYETKEKKQKFEIDILDLTNRYVGIGINCLTVIKNVRKRTDPTKKRNYFLIHSRSDKIIESPNKVHVVPAGSYQPITSIDSINQNNTASSEFNRNMENTVYREFCEEILNTNHANEINSFRLLTESNDYQFCKKFLKVYYIGAGIEPYNTKMEILALGVIDIDEIVKEKDSDLIKAFIDEHKVVNNVKKALAANEKLEDKINLDLLSSIITRKDEVVDYQSIEGEIKFEKLSRAMFEQYYSHNHITPSGKEIFGFMYEHYDKLF